MNTLILAAVLALAASPPAPPSRFDLACVGATGEAHGITWNPVDIYLRVDVAAGKWCEGDCSTIHDLADVQPSRIFLEKQSEYEKIREIAHIRSIDRVTGEYTYLQESPRGAAQQRALCTARAFSGFPAIPTKF